MDVGSTISIDSRSSSIGDVDRLTTAYAITAAKQDIGQGEAEPQHTPTI
jgi:hypothetical protein